MQYVNIDDSGLVILRITLATNAFNEAYILQMLNLKNFKVFKE